MSVLSSAQAAAALRAAGFPESEIPTGVAVGMAESSLNTDATHRNADGSTDYGWLQINSVHAQLLTRGNWRDPVDNARMGYAVWSDAGGHWTPWSTYNARTYLIYLNAAKNGANVAGVVAPTPSATAAPSDALHAGFWKRAGLVIIGAIILLFALWNFLPEGTRATVRTATETAAVL